MRVRHVEPAPAEQDVQCVERSQIAARINRRAQRRLHCHLKARRGRLLQEMIPAASDDRDPEVIWIERLRAAEREHTRPALQPGDEGGHPQWPDVHQPAHLAEAAEASRSQ
jgi:hypothetical protein